MNNELSNFNNTIDNIKVDRKNAFKINQLKLEHFYWNSGDLYDGMTVTTSIELTCNYNFEKQTHEWKKTISHTYLSIENDKPYPTEYSTDTYDEEIVNPDKIIKEIENYDLRELKNNYFTENGIERFARWELTYNNYFKIVGTYDQTIPQFEKISELLQFKIIIDIQNKKMLNKLKNM